MRPMAGGSPLKQPGKQSASTTKTRNTGAIPKSSTATMVSPRQPNKVSSPRTQGLLHTEQRHLSHLANVSSIQHAGSSLSHSKMGYTASGTASHALATMNQTVSYEQHSAERPPKKLSTTTISAEPDLVREIYRLSELERWPKEKLFKVLADPAAFKRSLRHAKVRSPSC